MSRARIVLGAVVLLLAGFVFASFASSAGKPKAETDISYKNKVTPTKFVHSGRVSSESPKCIKNRLVKLYGETYPEPFAKTRTDADGRYRITSGTDGIATDYYTRAKSVEKGQVVCRAAESPHKPLN